MTLGFIRSNNGYAYLYGNIRGDMTVKIGGCEYDMSKL